MEKEKKCGHIFYEFFVTFGARQYHLTPRKKTEYDFKADVCQKCGFKKYVL